LSAPATAFVQFLVDNRAGYAHCMYCRQAYKRAALKYHPDKVPSEERDEAERKFKQARPDLCD